MRHLLTALFVNSVTVHFNIYSLLILTCLGTVLASLSQALFLIIWLTSLKVGKYSDWNDSCSFGQLKISGSTSPLTFGLVQLWTPKSMQESLPWDVMGTGKGKVIPFLKYIKVRYSFSYSWKLLTKSIIK